MGRSLLMDDNRGRIAARSEGVHVIGSGAVLPLPAHSGESGKILGM